LTEASVVAMWDELVAVWDELVTA